MPVNTPSLESRIGNPQDPGAVDNRLSLDPNDPNWKNILADWEDGGEYKVRITITQISPGEFEVTGLTAKPASREMEDEDEGEDEEENYPEPREQPKVRKAVREMMIREGA